jgi:Asp/Glu/hydantoin racemase
MADLARYLEGKLGVPVIDGVAAAVEFAEALAE